jgi:hypothetical protein
MAEKLWVYSCHRLPNNAILVCFVDAFIAFVVIIIEINVFVIVHLILAT